VVVAGVSKLRVLDLFSGIGGFSLGLERTGGFETVAFCEINPFAQKVLAKHWPEVPIHDDVTTLEPVGPVDVVTAGFPCQDISFAGDGAGLAGSRSGLFWHILRTAGLVGRPRLLLENVAALLSRGLGEVLGALASFGYDAEWHCIPASAVGAPHRRDRIWIACHPNDEGQSNVPVHDEAPGLSGLGADADRLGFQRVKPCIVDAQGWPRPLSGSLGPLLAKRGREWPTEPDLPRVAHGLPDQSHRIEALGNAVVPAIPELMGRAVLQAEAAE
jgi:DNA (cytosine-5)-methyltransferase 1